MDFEKELRRVAKQYEDEGYTVTLVPRGDQLPPFAAGLELDMIAVRGEEHVAVEVKQRRSDLADDPGVTRTAALVNNQPGWRFDLVLLEPDDPLARSVRGAPEPSTQDLSRSLDEAEALVGYGMVRAACVMGWAALEAAMRRAVNGFRDEPGWATRPKALLSKLYAEGKLTRPEFDRLEEAWRVRSQAVHGFGTGPVEPALVQDLIAVSRRLLAEGERPQAVAG